MTFPFLVSITAAASKLQNEILDAIADGICEDEDYSEECLLKWGDTPYFFDGKEPRILPKGTWLVHFTSDPQKIIKDGFHGADLRWLGLTKGGGPRKPGKHALAYKLKTYKNWQSSSQYGQNAVVFQCDDAVEGYHRSDEEWQVIFPTASVKNLKALLRNKDGSYSLTLPTGPINLNIVKPAILERQLQKK